jgi:hypothetical protein
MKYYYRITKSENLTLDQLQKILPGNFSIQKDENGVFIIIDKADGKNEEKSFHEVQRECDRIYFLTGELLNPVLSRVEESDNSGTGYAYIRCDAHIVASLPSNVEKQIWQKRFVKQLRFYYIADITEPIDQKINFYFKVIEASYPETNNNMYYPAYTESQANADIPPDTRTEAKLLRDFTSHGKENVNGSQLKYYCKYLKISEEFFDPTNNDHIRITKSKCNFIRNEARKIIDEFITKNPSL